MHYVYFPEDLTVTFDISYFQVVEEGTVPLQHWPGLQAHGEAGASSKRYINAITSHSALVNCTYLLFAILICSNIKLYPNCIGWGW